MRRVILPALAVLLSLGIAACGGDDKDHTENTTGTASTTVAPTPITFVTLGVQEAYTRLGANGSAVIVDVRQPEEWADTGVPPHAVLMSLADVAQRAPAELPKDQEIFVICRSGNRSRTASQTLIDLGYTNVHNIDGGITAWIAAGLPTEAYAP